MGRRSQRGKGTKGKSWNNLSNKINRVLDYRLTHVLNTHGSILIETDDWISALVERTANLCRIPNHASRCSVLEVPETHFFTPPCRQHTTSFQRTQYGNRGELGWLYSREPDRHRSQVTKVNTNRTVVLRTSPLMWDEDGAFYLCLIMRGPAGKSQKGDIRKRPGPSLSKPSRSSSTRKPENLSQPRGAWGTVTRKCPVGSWMGPWHRRKDFGQQLWICK